MTVNIRRQKPVKTVTCQCGKEHKKQKSIISFYFENMKSIKRHQNRREGNVNISENYCLYYFCEDFQEQN
mgnify:FL=1